MMRFAVVAALAALLAGSAAAAPFANPVEAGLATPDLSTLVSCLLGQ